MMRRKPVFPDDKELSDRRRGLCSLKGSAAPLLLLMLLLVGVAAAAVTLSSMFFPTAPRDVRQIAQEVVPAEQSMAEGEVAAEEHDAPSVFIEVNIPATELILYEDGIPLFVRRVAIGRGIYPTPEQESAIRRIEWNPWWYPPDAPWAKNEKPTPPGPSNPLGLVKMPLSQEILFHGTNSSWSIGRAASHGCMRMYNHDVTELAWYLQRHFSQERDPSLRELYRTHRRKTYTIHLQKPVPVRLVYRPVVARDGALTFYPDHYWKVAGRKRAAIITELLRAGYEIETIDDRAITRLADEWPVGESVPILKLLRAAPHSVLAFGAECS